MTTRSSLQPLISLTAFMAFCLASALPALGNEHGRRAASSLSETASAVATPAHAALAPATAAKIESIQNLSFSKALGGIKVSIDATGPLHGRVSILKNPDRILVVFPNTQLLRRKVAKEIGRGSLLRGRLAQHPDGSVWLVLDLSGPVKHWVNPAGARGYSLTIDVGEASASPVAAAVDSAPTVPHRAADLPKINLMFFDLNVLFQGKQYDRFPCANFIYDKADQFPLKREFVTTIVFHEGYGAFVGNLRVVDPKGNVIGHTQEPIAFNLFNELFDYSVEVPWKLEFPEKGYYSLILTLNGEDVLEHSFYVGHNDDRPGKAVKK
jgi:hypothetical protein